MFELPGAGAATDEAVIALADIARNGFAKVVIAEAVTTGVVVRGSSPC